jgi:hypothetical protein
MVRVSQPIANTPVLLHQNAGAGSPPTVATGALTWMITAKIGIRMTARVKALRD